MTRVILQKERSYIAFWDTYIIAKIRFARLSFFKKYECINNNFKTIWIDLVSRNFVGSIKQKGLFVFIFWCTFLIYKAVLFLITWEATNF